MQYLGTKDFKITEQLHVVRKVLLRMLFGKQSATKQAEGSATDVAQYGANNQDNELCKIKFDNMTTPPFQRQNGVFNKTMMHMS